MSNIAKAFELTDEQIEAMAQAEAALINLTNLGVVIAYDPEVGRLRAGNFQQVDNIKVSMWGEFEDEFAEGESLDDYKELDSNLDEFPAEFADVVSVQILDDHDATTYVKLKDNGQN